mmetsp:Transcript_7879/g.17656  ORF Transcript_7879/g.17656 Transcript_7879/m.17656 type:complete len:106 (-) Transcript_7879:253-570(-)
MVVWGGACGNVSVAIVTFSPCVNEEIAKIEEKKNRCFSFRCCYDSISISILTSKDSCDARVCAEEVLCCILRVYSCTVQLCAQSIIDNMLPAADFRPTLSGSGAP